LNKILLLEDDPVLAKTIKKFLEKNNYEVDWARDGEDASELVYENRYDLYLFDINLPRFNGDDLLLSLREADDKTPAILISALVDIDSITKGFQSGADDYIKKPFDPQELLVRIRSKTKELKKSITYKDYTIYLDEDKIFYKDEELYLSAVHKNIFLALVKNYPNPVVKDELMLYLESQTDLALRVNITKLKQKLSLDIQNVRGVGYKLA